MIRYEMAEQSHALMGACEESGLPYLMRLRLTKNVKRAIERLAGRGDWADAGQGWQGIDTTLKLSGWGRARRVVLLRRRIKDEPERTRAADNPDQCTASCARRTARRWRWRCSRATPPTRRRSAARSTS